MRPVPPLAGSGNSGNSGAPEHLGSCTYSFIEYHVRRPCKIYSWLFSEQDICTFLVLRHPFILLDARSVGPSDLVRFFCPRVPIVDAAGTVSILGRTARDAGNVVGNMKTNVFPITSQVSARLGVCHRACRCDHANWAGHQVTTCDLQINSFPDYSYSIPSATPSPVYKAPTNPHAQ